MSENCFKHALKEMSLHIRCFIIKLVFYHLASYADELQIAAEEIMLDIMDVQVNDWVAVTYKNNWFPSIVLKVKSINSSHSFFLNTLPIYLMRIDPSLGLFRRREWKFCKSFGGGGDKGGWIEVARGLYYIFISIAVKTWNIPPSIWL